MPMVLVPLDGGSPLPLEKAIVLFGRGADCDVVLKNSRKVSRKHCCIAQIDHYFLVRDLGSMNGVRVNRRTVEGEARLKPGDELWVGDLGFRFLPSEHEQVQAARKRPAIPAEPLPTPLAVSKPGPPDPRFMSLDIPVAIPEESVDFEVEQSAGPRAIPSDEIGIVDEGSQPEI